MSTLKKRRSSKYIFTLKNIDTEKIDQKYGIAIRSNLTHDIDPPPVNITKLTELSDSIIDKRSQIISFLDESKKNYQCHISMIDFKTGKDVNSLKYHCYWDRHPFNSKPIGCPINYVSSKATKDYFSEISKEDRVIRENITRYKRQLFYTNKTFMFTAIKDKINCKFDIDKGEYYETDGIFCSFNCMMAFIKENKHLRLYEQSYFLALKLYYDLTGIKDVIINHAPHWRLLEEYGGDKTINQFRENFNKLTYEYQGIVKSQKMFKPIGFLFEEKINF